METTKARVWRLRFNNPRLSAVEIARQVGVTRERIRQILVALHMPTRIKAEPVKWCRACGTSVPRVKMFCSRVCQSKFHNIEVICYGCGVGFTLRRSVYQVRKGRNHPTRLWHSRACWSAHHEKHYVL